MKKLFLIVIAGLLSACASTVFTRTESTTVLVRERMEVQADSSWNRFTPGNAKHREIWTQHGFTLDQLVFFAGVPDGKPLDDLAPRERKAPRFSAAMTPEDIVSLVETLLAGSGGSFELTSLAPARMSDAAGFRFEFLFSSRNDEVERAGIAIGAIVDGRLYLVLYAAPRGPYFDRGQAGATYLMESVRILPAASK